jgi:hypothetical protein
MHLYLNYAWHHWVLSGENLPNKVIAAEYQTVLPDKQVLAHEVKTTRRLIEERMALIQDKSK